MYFTLEPSSSVKHAIRIHDRSRERWILLHCKSAEAKEGWMEAFRKERNQVSRYHY